MPVVHLRLRRERVRAARCALVFVDVRPDTLNLDERRSTTLVTERTRAIVPDALRRRRLRDRRDRATAGCAVARPSSRTTRTGSSRRTAAGRSGRSAPSRRRASTRRRTSPAARAAPLRQRPALVEAAEIVREKGTNRKRFFRGEVDRTRLGRPRFELRASELLAAFLFAQLDARAADPGRAASGSGAATTRRSGRGPPSTAALPFVPDHCEQSFHMYYVLLPTPESRTRLLATCASAGSSPSSTTSRSTSRKSGARTADVRVSAP